MASRHLIPALFCVPLNIASAQEALRALLPPGATPPAPLAAEVTAPPESPAGEDVIYDSLCITNEQRYDNGFGSWCGGGDVFGGRFNYETADDFVLRGDCTVTSMTADFVSFLADPPSSACVSFYRLTGDGPPDDEAACQTVSRDLVVTPFSDTVFGLQGHRVRAQISCALPPGRWAAVMQPISGDWGYVLGSTSPNPCGGDASISAWNRLGRGGLHDCCQIACTRDCDFTWYNLGESHGDATLSMRITTEPCEPRLGACCFDDGTCREMGDAECSSEGGAFQGEGVECGRQCLCPLVKEFTAQCRRDGGRIRAVVRFTGPHADGQSVTIRIDEQETSVPVIGRRARLRSGPFSGEHVVAMTDPDCGNRVVVNCGG